MTRATFRAALVDLGLTPADFAALAGLHPKTAEGWGRKRPPRGMQTFPTWVGLLLDAWREHPELMRVQPPAAEPSRSQPGKGIVGEKAR